MHQLLLGAAFPFALAALIYAAHRCRAGLAFLILTPLAMALCAVWAVVPDIPRLLGMTNLYLELAQNPRMDLFFWHYSIDRAEGYWAGYNVLFALMLFALLAIAWRELRLRERGT